MKTLYVLRHAKSSWDNANLTDFERPLNPRGIAAAPFMGRLMHERGFIPDTIVSSPATRGRHTAELVRGAAHFGVEITHDERIYEATVEALIEVISEIGESHVSAMLVGHNPGMEDLVRFLTGQFVTMPTAALAVIQMNIEHWEKVSAACGELRTFFRPKDLMV